MSIPKILAFHLPQFHQIPENDEWWGEGFTEWTNVRKARPLFSGHYQPRIPQHSKYYNLLDNEVQDWQASLAQQHGIYGFCYYHYWFNGRRLLERPVEQLLERGKPDFPFCLAWANEPWTRAWDGGTRHVLMPQDYGGPEEWREHIYYMIRVFQDYRYIRVRGKPLFLIYRSADLRDLKPMLEVWHNELFKAGLPGLHLVSIANGFNVDARVHLFDAYADFEPMYTILNLPHRVARKEKKRARRASIFRHLFGWITSPPYSFSYREIWKLIEDRPLPPHHYPGAFVDWDNSPRRGIDHSLILRDFDHEAFVKGITCQIDKARAAGAEFLFINAWNEWAEGTYLEPDERRGLFFLQAIRDALNAS